MKNEVYELLTEGIFYSGVGKLPEEFGNVGAGLRQALRALHQPGQMRLDVQQEALNVIDVYNKQVMLDKHSLRSYAPLRVGPLASNQNYQNMILCLLLTKH